MTRPAPIVAPASSSTVATPAPDGADPSPSGATLLVVIRDVAGPRLDWEAAYAALRVDRAGEDLCDVPDFPRRGASRYGG